MAIADGSTVAIEHLDIEDGAVDGALPLMAGLFGPSVGEEVGTCILVKAAETEKASAMVEDHLEDEADRKRAVALADYSRTELPQVLGAWGLDGIATASDCTVVPGTVHNTFVLEHSPESVIQALQGSTSVGRSLLDMQRAWEKRPFVIRHDACRPLPGVPVPRQPCVLAERCLCQEPGRPLNLFVERVHWRMSHAIGAAGGKAERDKRKTLFKDAEVVLRLQWPGAFADGAAERPIESV